MAITKNNHPENDGILIVEDSPTQAEQLRHMLSGRYQHVTVAANGKEALRSAREHKPALIISDVIMPEMNGYALCRAIKSDDNLRDVPVILVTTLSDPKDIILGLACGADNFIRKPFSAKYLLSRLDQILAGRELRKSARVQVGVEIYLGGQRHFINAERQQILDLLIGTYEDAVRLNEDLRERERALAHSNRSLAAMFGIAGELNKTVTERAVAEGALKQALELPGVRAGWVAVAENGTFRTLATCNLPPALEAPGALEGLCACRRKLLSGELDSVTNILECERLQKTEGDTQGLLYHVSVPIRIGDQAVGLMNLVGSERGLFTDDDLKNLHTVRDLLGIALARARMHENLERLVEERTAKLTAEIAERKEQETRVARLNRVYSVLSGINTTIVRVHARDDLFAEACRIAVEHGKFVMAWIGMVDAASENVKPAAIAGRDEGYLGRIVLTANEDTPDSCKLVARALSRREPVVCNDISADEAMSQWRDEALERGYRSVALFPLLLEQRPVGVFALYAAEPGFFDDQEMKLLVEMAGDISFALDHIAKEEKLNYLAYYDALTGLPNRALFDDRMAQRLRAAGHKQSTVALVLFDLERFRVVNDTLGRTAADRLLKLIAERLQGVIFDRDSLARVHAGVFAALFSDIGDETDIARIVEEKIIACLNQSFTIEGQELRVSAKIGVALFPGDAKEPDALFSAAEAALKQAKKSSDRYLFYARKMNAQVAERLKLENKLQRALERDEFVLFYQPKVDLNTGRVAGLEALIRWNDPGTGLVVPMLFIPVLEETGMIVEVGAWAMKQAVLQYAVWQAAGLRPLRIAVNVSQVQLKRRDFVTSVQQAIAIAGKSDHGLDIEITESMIMEDVESSIEKLKLVRSLGAGIAIDDFGTGYSSLRYLARLPVTALKIDRAFVRDVTTNPDNRAIVSTVISLAHNMKLTVVAEGVETGEQRDLLKSLDCDEMQGYLFSKPVPAEQVPALLAWGGKSGGAG